MPDPLDIYARETSLSDDQVDAFVRQLDHDRRQQASRSAPSRVRALRWPVAALAVAAAVFLLVRPPPTSDPRTGMRGMFPAADADTEPVQVSLRLAVEQGSVTQLLRPEQPAATGDRIFFRVSTTGAGPITVWGDGPTGRQALSRFEADGAGEFDVPLNDALLAWRFDTPGRYRFWATPEADGRCPPQVCQFRDVTVH